MDGNTKTVVETLKQEILARRPAEWPSTALFAFVRTLGPTAVGSFASELVARLLTKGGLKARKVGSRKDLFSVVVGDKTGGGPLRVAIKCSTELPTRRFQQVRDPRPDETTDRWRYDCLVCVGVSPDDLTIWFVPGEDVARLIDDGLITVQHTDSETNWFFPNESDTNCAFAGFIVTSDALVEKVKAAKPLVE